MKMNSQISDGFSWRRSMSLYHFYSRGIKKQLLIYAGLFIAVYLLMVLVARANPNDEGHLLVSYGILGTLLGYMIYITPVVFIGADETLMTELPVTPGEKFAFYLTYMVVVAIIVGQALWYLLGWLGSFVFDVGNITLDVQEYGLAEFGGGVFPGFMAISYFSSIAQTLLIVMTGLYVALHVRKHTVVKCLLVPVIYTFLVGTLSGISGVMIAMTGGWNSMAEGHVDVDRVTGEFIKGITPIIIGLIVLMFGGCVIVTRMLYKRFQHPRIA